MSSNPLPDVSAPDQEFASVWAESTGQVLQQLAGSPFTSTPRLPAVDEDASDVLWSRFRASGRLEGEFAFWIPKSDGVRLSQLLMGEPLDASVAFDDSRAVALGEILRQFAGVASTACKSKYGGEVQFALDESATPEWQPVAQAHWVFAAPKIDPLRWTLAISAGLHDALAAPEPPAIATENSLASDASASEQPTAPFADAASPANLDLLLDVQLEASLRFGQRDMLLRDILELHPGSVVELDRRVQEPAELIVSGRLIAHGEVVIVDGNYGLRITDIAQPSQRLQSLDA